MFKKFSTFSRYFAIAALVLSCSNIAKSQESVDRKIEELMEVQNTMQSFTDAAKILVTQARDAYPSIPAAFWDELSLNLKDERMQGLKVSMKELFKKHFTEEEIVYMLEFYKSPLGQSILAKQQMLVPESMEIGRAWGEQLGMEIYQRIQEEDIRLYQMELSGCESYHNGTFAQVYSDSTQVVFNRTGIMQQETYDGETYYYSVEWVHPCRYRLTQVDESLVPYDEYDILEVNIYETFDGGYHAITSVPGSGYYDKSSIYVVE